MKDLTLELSITEQIKRDFGSLGDTDSYKLSHHPQYAAGATRMMSYICSRGGLFDESVWFGLQAIIKQYLCGRVTEEQAKNMVAWAQVHMMDNQAEELEVALVAVANDYSGRIPITIRSIPEGSIVPAKIPLATIESVVDDPRIFSIVSYFETRLLSVWAPTTVATNCYNIRKTIYAALELSADDPDAEIDFKLHDFGSRGTPGQEASMMTGLGQLAIFKGSDNIAAILGARYAYDEPMAAFSINASEHSSTTSHGRGNEERLVDVMFDRFAKPGAIFATVIDSYDAIDFIRTIAPKYEQRLIDSGATWVFRPDSGDPIKMPVQTVVELDKVFGHSVNTKGYKVLNNVRVIQGDGIGPDQVGEILWALFELGYSASNIAFGMGGGLLQKINRDTLKFSMKCCAIKVHGEWNDVYKDPAVYDEDWNVLEDVASFKTSLAGVLETMVKDGEYKSITRDQMQAAKDDGWDSAFKTIFHNGFLLEEQTLEEVRSNWK